MHELHSIKGCFVNSDKLLGYVIKSKAENSLKRISALGADGGAWASSLMSQGELISISGLQDQGNIYTTGAFI